MRYEKEYTPFSAMPDKGYLPDLPVGGGGRYHLCPSMHERGFTLTIDNGRLIRLTDYDMTDWETNEFDGTIGNVDL